MTRVVFEASLVEIAVGHCELAYVCSFSLLKLSIIAITIWEKHGPRTMLDSVNVDALKSCAVWTLFSSKSVRHSLLERAFEHRACCSGHLSRTLALSSLELSLKDELILSDLAALPMRHVVMPGAFEA